MLLDSNKNVNSECVFCNEDLGFDPPKRVRHIGRHMEEIAFAIVTKPYEEWDFYSMSSERYLDGQGPGYSEHFWYPCICYYCGVKIHTIAERAKHLVSVHGLSVAAASAQSGGGYQCRCFDSLANMEEGDTASRSRLTQEQLALLEHEFGPRYKPNPEYKKGLAERMGVEYHEVNVSNINAIRIISHIDISQNWFQNRRAKAKYQTSQDVPRFGLSTIEDAGEFAAKILTSQLEGMSQPQPEEPPCNTARQSALTTGLKRPLNNKKQPSFKDEVESRTRLNKPVEDERIFESSEEEDSKDNMIEEDSEEDDTSEWEDYIFEKPDSPKEPLSIW